MQPRPRLIALIALLIASFNTDAFAGDNPQRKFNVGVVIPLSGDGAAWGTAVKNGIDLAWERLPPEQRDRLSLHFEDDQMQQKSSISAFKKLLAERKVDLLINATSGTGHALAPLAEQAKVPMIAIATDTKISAGKKYVMNFAAAPDRLARAISHEVERRGYNRIARITSTQEGTLSMRRGFDAVMPAGLKIHPDEDYPIEVKDFRPLIAKIKREEASIDAVEMILLAGQSGIFARQIREAGIDKPLFGFHMFEDSSEYKASNGALLGAWFATVEISDPEFIRMYNERFDDGVLWFAAYGHDALLMLGKTSESALTTEDVNRGLHALSDFRGAIGPFSAQQDNTFSINVITSTLNERGTRSSAN